MKRIKQTILYFREGNSDKVYEVDLYDSGDDLFLVNFRYGRRGSVLREGTKTVFPVPFDEAEAIFNKLVESKEKKGYWQEGAQPEVTDNATVEKGNENTQREETILTYLKAGASGTYTRNWKLSKIIARAEKLELRSAIPYIQFYLQSQDEFEQYAAIKALAFFGDDSMVDTVYSIFTEKGFDNKVGRIAVAYLLLFNGDDYWKKISTAVNEKLTPSMANSIRNGADVTGILALSYMQAEKGDPCLAYWIYLLSFEHTSLKKPLLAFINTLPLKANTFKAVRYIFRTAQLVNDLETYALVAKRMAVSSPGFYSDYVYKDGEWIFSREELKTANPSIAFSAKTQQYFNRTIYKYLYQLGQTDTAAYISLATQLLCALDKDADTRKTTVKYHYVYLPDERRYDMEVRRYPNYNNFLALMYVLYGGSERYTRSANQWYFTGNDQAADQLPREEPLSAIWDQYPNEVLYILAHSKSDEATQFAIRILKDNPRFLDQVSVELLAGLTAHPNYGTVHFVLNYLKEKYAQELPESSIILALLKSPYEDVGQLAFSWIEREGANYLNESGFLPALLQTGNPMIFPLLKSISTDIPTLAPKDLAPLFEQSANYTEAYLVELAALIGSSDFGRSFASFTKDDIQHLLASEVVTNKLFAANICKHHPEWIYPVFGEKIAEFIAAENELLRQAGIELFAHFPDAFLLEERRNISKYYFSEYASVRKAIQPTIARLVELDKAFKDEILARSLSVLCEKESFEGMHENTFELLNTAYAADLKKLQKEQLLELIASSYEYAQKLGTPLFLERAQTIQLAIEELALLAQSDVWEIRDFLRDFCYRNSIRINYELEGALRIFNSNWPDIFNWCFSFFETEIHQKNWTVDLLMYVCDHTNLNVQAFGRKLVTSLFTNEKGLDLLMKLQEHPTKSMQFFTTNYLNNYAADNEAVILQLEAFFKTVLFNLNSGRATKTRVFAFLEAESVKNHEVAKMTIGLLNSILSTQTITDQSHCIDLLLNISETYPDIEIPFTVKPLEAK